MSRKDSPKASKKASEKGKTKDKHAGKGAKKDANKDVTKAARKSDAKVPAKPVHAPRGQRGDAPREAPARPTAIDVAPEPRRNPAKSAAKRVSRAQQRDLLVAAAGRIQLPATADVVVCGGGAAGLVAAIAAAESGARTVVVERDLECGRKILATGNGRCNLTNLWLNADVYRHPAFVRRVCGEAWRDDVLRFFEESGLATCIEDEGRVCPLSRQAASVRDVLLARALRAGVMLAAGRTVAAVDTAVGTADGLAVHLDETAIGGTTAMIAARSVVVATGGASELAKGLGLAWVPTRPVLCPLACTGAPLAELDGRHAHARLSLARNGQELAVETGDLLFRTYGISGIAVFNLSRLAQPGDQVEADLLPELGLDAALLLARNAGTAAGVMDPQVARALGGGERAVRAAKCLRLAVTGLAEPNRAQVTAGGLDVVGFSPATLEATLAPGIFACGEALDVDGPCGGFNLAWAWKSGMVAGRAAAAHAAGNIGRHA